MKILVIAHYQNDHSPCAIFVHDQVKALATLGHKILVLVPTPVGKKDYYRKRLFPISRKEIIDGVDYIFFKYLSFSHFGEYSFNIKMALFSLRRFVLKYLLVFQPNIIHAHTIGFDSEIGFWLKQKLSCPLMVSVHGSDVNIPFRKGKIGLIRKWCNHADAIICVGKKLRTTLIDCKVNTCLYTINNGFNSDLISEKNKLNKKPFSIIQVCNLIPLKRVNVTIKAFSKLKQKYSSCSLTIIGDGPERKRIESLISDLGLEHDVELKGYLSNQETIREMEKSEFFVMVSSPEGFGIVYLEAMACKCLTIGTMGEGISEIIKTGSNGFLLPVDDEDSIVSTISLLIDNPSLKNLIVENGYNSAMEHTWLNNAKELVSLFSRYNGMDDI